MYLSAHSDKLQEWNDKISAYLTDRRIPPGPYVKLLVSRRFEFESAIRFVREAFIKPRLDKDLALVLQVADWLCVDAFQLFVVAKSAGNAADYPLGPLVALDSRRSPAMWNGDQELTVPSLFDLTARIHRAKKSSTSGLAVFPVITLPADLSRLPEYYALLSHEVGHAVDAAFGFTRTILENLEDSPLWLYWKAWMREIVADAIGVTLSGEAFALAWWRFVRPMSPKTDLTYSDPYPPIALRLSFLRKMLARRGKLTALPKAFPGATSINHTDYRKLDDEFGTRVLPLLDKVIFSVVPFPPGHERFTRQSARHAVKQKGISWLQKEFRLVPSVLTQAITRGPGFKTWDALMNWVKDFRTENQPRLPLWQTDPHSEWSFTREFLPTLSPTILGPDGVTKVPPGVLLITHDRIAFLGATQKWLLAALEETVRLRDKPWEQMDIYFATDSLLESVEAYEDGFRRSTSSLREERDKALADLKAFFRRRPFCCGKVHFLSFDGPPVFASYWDWDKQGGRIHISPQLPGIDISKCPAIDHIWLQDVPTFTYDQYRQSLRTISARARLIPV